MCPHSCVQARVTEYLPLKSKKMVPPGAKQFHLTGSLSALALATTHLFILACSFSLLSLMLSPRSEILSVLHLPYSSASFNCQLRRDFWEKLSPPTTNWPVSLYDILSGFNTLFCYCTYLLPLSSIPHYTTVYLKDSIPGLNLDSF